MCAWYDGKAGKEVVDVRRERCVVFSVLFFSSFSVLFSASVLLGVGDVETGVLQTQPPTIT